MALIEEGKTIRVGLESFAACLSEQVRLKRQVDELQARGTELLDETRAQRRVLRNLLDLWDREDSEMDLVKAFDELRRSLA